MFAFLGFCCIIWLLISPCFRLFRLTRQQDGLQMPLLDAGAQLRVNRWLVCWFAFSLLASICWIRFYDSSKKYAKVDDETQVSWLWPNEDFYLRCVIWSGLISNCIWLIWVGILDYKMTLLCSGAATAVVSLLIGFGFGYCRDISSICWFHSLGWIAAGVSFLGNICRIISVDQHDSSWFALSVAVAGTAPEILWMCNARLVEFGTVFPKSKKLILLWDIFLKKNAHWKASWTLNFLLRLPELAHLTRWAFTEGIDLHQICHNCYLSSAEFFSSFERPIWLKQDEAFKWVRRD